ncbi:MAG: hypothetical protein JEZ09_03250 [Salinivirgaceae bacterium]|nr:hypothetical protein [Salinivirgaceae bacterium]
MNKYFWFITFLFLICFGLNAQVRNQESTNGHNIFYYPNGQISSEGNMKDGKPDGIWKAYYVNGTLKSIGKRQHAFLDSVWNFYNEDGNIREKINYLNGKKNGYYYSFDYFLNSDSVQVGFLRSQELYLDNKRKGISEYYFKNGVVERLVNYEDGKKHGTTRVFNEEGILTSIIEYRYGKEVDRERINRFQDSLKIGVWKEFYPNGKVKIELNYKLGVLHGLVKEYNLSGELIGTQRYLLGELKDTAVNVEAEINIVEEFYNLRDSTGELIKKSSGGFADGKPIGVHREYDSLGRVVGSRLFDSNGNLIGEGIVDEEGDKVGDWKFYYDTGQLKSKGRYSRNRRIGPWVYYYREGAIEQRGRFRSGIPDGEWTWYFENENIKRKEYYKLGKEEGESIEYDEVANVISKGSYVDGFKEGEWFYDFYFHTEKGTYKNDLRNGNWEYHYKNGDIYFTGSFLEGNADGKHIFYYHNEKVKEIRYYLFGRKIKNWEYYDYYGSLLKILTFDNNKLIKIDGISVETD